MVLIAGAIALLEQAGVIARFTESLFSGANVGIAGRWLGSTDLPVVSGALYLAAIVLGLLLFIRLLSTVWAVVRLYDFRLTRIGDELHTEYGLFTRVNATIPLRRVQTVIVRDRMLHRLLGRRAVVVETAGGGAVETSGRSREPIAPILRVDQLPALLDEIHPGCELDRISLEPVHPRAFGRLVRGSLLLPLAVSAVAFFFVQAWALAILLVLITVAVIHARLRIRNLGWSLTPDSIVVRDGALTRATRIARFNRVQVVAIDRNPFDLRTGMARVRADTAGAGTGVVIPYLAERTAHDLRDELATRTVATAFTW
jgi:putative membrane protein